jgi:colanic acid/amylovoran biosynthesis glycosyltransferase
VIVSMKKGLDHFVYRELQSLAKQGFSLRLFPTRYALGLHNAQEDWPVHRWSPLGVVLRQPYYFLREPFLYIRLLWEAMASGGMVDVALAWHFARQMGDVDAIYAICGDHKFFIGYFCKQILEKPLAVEIHAYELYRNPNPRLFARALSRCDRIITVTEHNKRLLVDNHRVEPSKIEVVRITVDTEDYAPGKKLIILIVAFFDERKGHEVLFKAISRLARDDIEVWVVGGHDGRAGAVDVRRQAIELGVDSQVAFFGKLGGNALKAAYRACDVFCLPCREDSRGVSEGFPTVLAEAMAFGKPVITTRHVEIPTIIDQIVVDENDVEALAEAIEHVCQSAPFRQRLGERNRSIAEAVFSTRNTESTARILGGLLDHRSQYRSGG